MNLGYTLPNAEFMIITGKKKHTMRDDRPKRWRTGMKIHHHVGRYKRHRMFHEGVCTGVQMVVLVLTKKGFFVSIDRVRMKVAQIDSLARNDGFETVEDMINWFFPISKKTKTRTRTMWAGRLIHWTPLKY